MKDYHNNLYTTLINDHYNISLAQHQKVPSQNIKLLKFIKIIF